MFAPLQTVADIFIAVFLTPPLAFVVWGVIGFAVGLWFVLKYYKPKPEDYTLEKFSEVVNNNLEESLNTLGVRANNTKLLKGLVKIGDVAKMIHERGIITTTADLTDKNLNSQAGENPDSNPQSVSVYSRDGVLAQTIKTDKATGKQTLVKKKVFDVYIFEINVNDSFLNIFGKGNERFVIDKDFVNYDPVRNIYQINENVNLFSYAKVWISSGTGMDYLNDIAWKRFTEHHIEETMNIPKKTAYLEMRHSKRIDLMEKETELQQAKYKQYKRSALLEEEQ